MGPLPCAVRGQTRPWWTTDAEEMLVCSWTDACFRLIFQIHTLDAV